jgi:predicted ATP-dependent endonuclease of OLD family
MEDIDTLWKNKIEFLKNKKTESETYLKNEFAEIAYDEDIYQNTSTDDFEKYSSDLIQKVLDRIKKDGQIKPKLKTALLDTHILEIKQSKSPKILHILKRYIESYEKTFELEKPLNQLCDACNKYLYNNELFFDPTKLDVYIRNRKTSESSPEKRIELSQLSSGEKQLVSLFTHLYLAEGKQYFLIIDEPEISLSVEWQETFLEDIRNGTFCSGLFVATHSPFMFDNSLRKYAHGVGRFLEVVEPSDDKQ